MNKKILITGAAGYIGSSLATELVRLNYEVVAVDILKYDQGSLSHLHYFKNFKFIKADITKPSVVKKIVKGCHYIIPLAAMVGAPLCERFKKETKKINIGSIKLLLRYLKKNQKIIYPTTNSGYGIGDKNKYCDENSPLRPISLYGVTKLKAEQLILDHGNSVCFRLATIFGYSYRMRTDLLVNNFVEKSVNSGRLDIFEPHFRRNFVHIRDVVSSFIFAIENFSKVKNNIFNLGLSSANITKIMLAKKIKKEVKNLKIKLIKGVKDPDQRDYYVSNKKIEKAGFKASISLETGINELVKLFKNSKVEFINNY